MALFGSVLPTIIGTVLAYSVLRVDNFTTAVAVGCSFGPTSAGIALEVLQPCGVLATPLGQLIVATAIIDDIIALVVLNNGCGNDNYGGGVKAAAIAVPIVSALGLVVCGWRHCPLRHMPKLLAQLDHLEQRTVLACRRFGQTSNGTNRHDDTTVKNNTGGTTTDTTIAREHSQQQQERKLVHVVLLLVALLPGKYYSRSSPLLGAFLAGLRRHDGV
jgi:hypothetical protein